ncbi:hypothetical protein QFZ67_005034 [Streptomyces sp. V1I1]|nr:hypothetical protein [Streptomyces sp. V1I1]
MRRPRGCADSAAGARGALRSDWRNSTRQAAVTAARPRAAAAAPPTDVPYTTSTTGTTTQLKAAQRTTSLAESDEGRGAASTRCPCCGAGEGSGAGADGRAGTKAPWRRRGDRGATRSGAFRSLARTSTAGSVAGSVAGSIAGSTAGSAGGGGLPTDGGRPAQSTAGPVHERPSGRPEQTAVDAKRHCQSGAGSGMLPGTPRTGSSSGQERSVAVPLGYGPGKMIPGHSSAAMPTDAPSPETPLRRSLTRGPSSPRHRWPVTKFPNPRTASR